MTTGPNTTTVHIASTIIIDAQARFIGEILKQQVENDVESFTLIKEAHDDFNEEIQQRISKLTWAADAGRTWYKDPKSGKIPTMWPGSTYEWMWRLYWPNFAHFRQVGGKKLVKGTSWTEQIVKYFTIYVLVTLSVSLGLSKRPLIVEGLRRIWMDVGLLRGWAISAVS